MRLSSADKALIVLKAFCGDKKEWGVRDIASFLDISPTTAQRLLKTLKRHGFLIQNEETKKYRLGVIYFRFVEVLQSTYPLPDEVIPFMKSICSKTGETTHLNVIDGRERLCINSIESAQSLKAGMPIGNRSPLYAGASSKCLLAFSTDDFIEEYLSTTDLVSITENTITDKRMLIKELKKIRKQGYASSLAERTPGLGSLSVPIVGQEKNIVAALSLALPELRYSSSEHRTFCLQSLFKAAETLSRRLGYGGDYPIFIDE